MLDKQHVMGAAAEASERFTVPWTPTEAMWGGLARSIMMWLDFSPKTPRVLFAHLKSSGVPIPDWLRNEPEMKSLDHVPSKGTRCVLIYRAMLMDCDTALEAPSRQEERRIELRDVLLGIEIYAQDTLSGEANPADSRERWYADGIREIRNRARAGLEPPQAKEQG